MRFAKHCIVTSRVVASWISARVIAFGTAAVARKLTQSPARVLCFVLVICTGVSGKEAGWILASLCVDYFEVVPL